MSEYEKYDDSKYIGNPITELTYKTERAELLLITLFDNRTYTIEHYVRGRRDYKRVDKASLAANDLEFHRIDPGFAKWFTAQLQKHYEI